MTFQLARKITKNHSHLRLIRPTFLGPVIDVPRTSTTELVLKSVNFSNLRVNDDALMDLLLSLNGSETISFQHSLPSEGLLGGYELTLRLTSGAERHDAFVARCSAAFSLACPAYHFEQIVTADAGESVGSAPVSYAWEIRLAPAILNRHLAEHRTSDDAPVQIELPYPLDMRGTGLTFDVLRNPSIPHNMRFSLSTGAVHLTLAECKELSKIKRRIEAGAVRAFHPDSPFQESFASNGSLLEKSGLLLDAWLRHPDRGIGWVLNVESTTDLTQEDLKRVAKACFGDRPIRVHKLCHDWHGMPLSLSFLDGIKPGQGIPSFFPADAAITKLGLAEHFSLPAIKPPDSGGAMIGSLVCGATSGAVALPAEDRFSHIGIFGASGSGKSTLLLKLLEQDLADPTHPGIGLIDPHGTLYADVLRLIPTRRQDDVVLVDVTDPSFVSSINPLAGMAQDRQYANFIANEIVALIGVLFEGKDTSGPTTRNHIKNALLLASCIPGRAPSFLDASRLFEDKDFRDYLISKSTDAKVHNYWRDFTATNGDSGFKNWLPFIQSRLSPFCDSPLMRRMLNAPQSKIDIDRCVAHGKIVLFNLSGSVLGSQEARIFGNLMLNRIFYASMRRKARGLEKINPFHLVVDEAASMVSASTMRLWAEARKFGLSLTTANQSISQLRSRNGDSEIAQSLLANTATKVFFRLSPSDASMLEPYTSPEFSAKELTRLPVFHSALSMSAHGQILPAFICKVQRPTVDPARHSLPSSIVEASRAAFSSPIASIVAELAATYDLPEDSFQTANDDPATKRQPDLFTDAGIPLVVEKTAAFERFASLMDDALGFVMGSRWTLNAGDIQDKVRLTKYFDPDAEQPPTFKAVYDLIEADAVLSLPTRFLVINALDTMRPHFWPETESTSAGAAV